MCPCYEHEHSVLVMGVLVNTVPSALRPERRERFPSESVRAMRGWEGKQACAILLSGDVWSPDSNLLVFLLSESLNSWDWWCIGRSVVGCFELMTILASGSKNFCPPLLLSRRTWISDLGHSKRLFFDPLTWQGICSYHPAVTFWNSPKVHDLIPSSGCLTYLSVSFCLWTSPAEGVVVGECLWLSVFGYFLLLILSPVYLIIRPSRRTWRAEKSLFHPHKGNQIKPFDKPPFSQCLADVSNNHPLCCFFLGSETGYLGVLGWCAGWTSSLVPATSHEQSWAVQSPVLWIPSTEHLKAIARHLRHPFRQISP